jgi:type IV secretion system protein VirB2
MHKLALLAIAFFVAFAVFAPDVLASDSGGPGLPYETAMQTLQKSLTGPVAFAIALFGIVVAGGVLIFGGGINGFFSTMCLIVLVASLLVPAQYVLKGFYKEAATIAYEMPPNQEAEYGRIC